MNTDIITLTEIKGTDSVSSSRITINDNFKKLVKAVGDLQTRIDTSKNTIYINVIETESGEFAIKTTPNHTTRFKINNSGEIFIGSVSLDEYIRRIVNNTKFVELKIYDDDGDPMNYQMYAGVESGNDTTNFVNVYYSPVDLAFKVKMDISDSILNLYPNAAVYIYGAEDIPGAARKDYYQTISLSDFVYCRFSFDPTSESSLKEQRTISISWIPNTAINEIYGFTLQRIDQQPTPPTPTPTEYTITVNANPAAGGTVTGGGTYQSGASVTISAVPANHYRFVRWNDGNTNASRTITVTANKSYTATFEQEEFTISMSYDDSLGRVTGNGVAGHSFTVRKGETLTLNAIPATGARFVKWWDSIDYPLRDIDNVTADLSLSALFEALSGQYTITTSVSPERGGSIIKNPDRPAYNSGDGVTLKAVANDGYVFTKWSDDYPNATRAIVVIENMTFTAKFERQ